MRAGRLNIITQVLVWICFLTIPYVFFPRLNDHISYPSEYKHYDIIFGNLILIIFYYLNTYVLLPRFFIRRNTLMYFVLVIVSYVVYFAVNYYARFHLFSFENHKPGPNIYSDTIIFLFFWAISSTLRLTAEWYSSEKRNEAIEKEKISTELAFLQSQINPHFIFNTLNNIYALAVTKSDKTAQAIMKLSNMMRYMVTDSKSSFVPLSKEVEYLEEYIELQRLRLNEYTVVNFSINGQYDGLEITPLLLIPFVENAFKYGVSTKEASHIDIDINIENQYITLHTFNRVFNREKVYETTGIGIDNTQRRLGLLYPDKYTLEMEEYNNSYNVTLKINLANA